MEQTFKLEILTPYRVFYSGSAVKLIVISSDGELGILAHHEPVVATVYVGSIRIQTDTQWKIASVSDGFLEIVDNCVTILVGSAEWPEEIDVPRAERSLKRAYDRLLDQPSPVEVKRSGNAVQRAKTRIKIALGTKDTT